MNEIFQQIIWPIVVIILVFLFYVMFREPITNWIRNIKVVKVKGGKNGIEVEMRHMDTDKDIIAAQNSKASNSIPQIIEPKGIPSDVVFGTPTITVGTPELSKEEIETSRLKAQQRIDEDTKEVGYQRGKLFLLKDGSYGVAWEVNVGGKITIGG